MLHDQVDKLQDIISDYQQEVELWKQKFQDLQKKTTQPGQASTDQEVDYLKNSIEQLNQLVALKDQQLQAALSDSFKPRHSSVAKSERQSVRVVTEKVADTVLQEYDNEISSLRLQNAELEKQLKDLQKENLEIQKKQGELLFNEAR